MFKLELSKLPIRQLIEIPHSRNAECFSKLPIRQLITSRIFCSRWDVSKLPIRQLILLFDFLKQA